LDNEEKWPNNSGDIYVGLPVCSRNSAALQRSAFGFCAEDFEGGDNLNGHWTLKAWMPKNARVFIKHRV
jgi:hypothetical protein